MAEHTGRCHCGAVQFKVDLDLKKLMTCNCSICGRTGSIMAFVPGTALEQTAGQSEQTDYQFGAKKIHHLFCTTCGVQSYGYGQDGKSNYMYMINLNCLEGFDTSTLTVTEFDGASL